MKIISLINLPLRKIVNKIRLIKEKRADKKFLEKFSYRKDDVVIVSYPKSGTTWLRFIITHLIKDNIPDAPRKIDFISVPNKFVPPLSRGSKDIDFKDLPSPRIMGSHSFYNKNFPKVVYLLRDGRDALVSYYYYFKKVRGFKGSLYDFLSSGLRESEWDEHINSWLYQNPSLSNLYLIRYEDMVYDTFHEIEKLVNFIDIEPSSKKIKKAIKESTFDKMREIEKKKGLGPQFRTSLAGIYFVRKGKVGSWKKEFGKKEKVFFKKRYGNILIKLGYEKSFLW